MRSPKTLDNTRCKQAPLYHFFCLGDPQQVSLSMSESAMSVLKVLSLACSWSHWDKAVWGAWAGWSRAWEGGEGQLTVGPEVPFRLLWLHAPLGMCFLRLAWVVMQDIITTKEQVQQFERMQALQLWMIAEIRRAMRTQRNIQAGDSLKT